MLKLVIILFLLLIPIVYSEVNVNYDLNKEGTIFDVYNCSGNCDNLSLIESNEISGQSFNYLYLNEGNYLYVVYGDCSLPFVREGLIDLSLADSSVEVILNTKENCSSATSVSVLPTTAKLSGEEVTIKTKIKSPLSKSYVSRQELFDELTNDKKEFFSTVTNVKLFINEDLFEERNETLFIGEEMDIEFNWIPFNNGTYSFKVVSEVQDCKCSSSYNIEKLFNLTVGTVTVENEPVEEEAVDDSDLNFEIPDEESTNPIIPINYQSTSTCESHDGCNLDCSEGDTDCTCDVENGFICNENQVCKGQLLKNFGNVFCCSTQCESGSLLNNSLVRGLFRRENTTSDSVDTSNGQRIVYNKQYPLALLLVIFFFGIAFGVLFGADKSRSAIVDFSKKEAGLVEEESKKTFSFLEKESKEGWDFIKKEKEIVKSKLNKKQKIEEKRFQTISPLLENIMESLNDEEKKTIMKIIENEGLTKEELKIKLGFTKEKLDYCLLKLDRRQIVDLKGDETNPKIYIHDWLK